MGSDVLAREQVHACVCVSVSGSQCSIKRQLESARGGATRESMREDNSMDDECGSYCTPAISDLNCDVYAAQPACLRLAVQGPGNQW